MDHDEAIRLQAAEKYVLGELSGALRGEFEEHFFDCAECAEELKAVAVFADNAREVLRQETGKETEKERLRAARGWFGEWKLMIALPAFAVLLLALGYQSFVTVPYWKQEASKATSPRVLPMYSLIKANTRGGDGQVIEGRPGEPIGLYLDVPAEAAYQQYALRLEDPNGKSTMLRTVSFSEAQRPVVVEVTPGNRAGAYQIVVLGLTEQGSDPARGTILASVKFQVELLK